MHRPWPEQQHLAGTEQRGKRHDPQAGAHLGRGQRQGPSPDQPAEQDGGAAGPDEQHDHRQPLGRRPQPVAERAGVGREEAAGTQRRRLTARRRPLHVKAAAAAALPMVDLQGVGAAGEIDAARHRVHADRRVAFEQYLAVDPHHHAVVGAGAKLDPFRARRVPHPTPADEVIARRPAEIVEKREVDRGGQVLDSREVPDVQRARVGAAWKGVVVAAREPAGRRQAARQEPDERQQDGRREIPGAGAAPAGNPEPSSGTHAGILPSDARAPPNGRGARSAGLQKCPAAAEKLAVPIKSAATRLGCCVIASALLSVPVAAQTTTTESPPTCSTSDALNVVVTRGDRELTVVWDTIEDVTHYDLTWSPASGDGTTTARAQGTSHTISGLSNLVQYTVSVNADTTLMCSTTVPSTFPPCPTESLDVTVAAGDGQLTASWGAVPGVTSYELAWEPPAADALRTAEVDETLYTITNLRNGMEYTVAVSAGADNACSVSGVPAARNAEGDGDDPNAPVPVPAIPLAGLAALAALLAAGGHLGRRRPAGRP